MQAVWLCQDVPNGGTTEEAELAFSLDAPEVSIFPRLCAWAGRASTGLWLISLSPKGKCVKCDACREQAPYATAVVDEFGPQ